MESELTMKSSFNESDNGQQSSNTSIPLTKIAPSEEENSSLSEENPLIPFTPVPSIFNEALEIQNDSYAIDRAIGDSMYLLGSMSVEDAETWILPVVQLPKQKLSKVSQSSAKEGYVLQFRKLVKNAGIYALASFATPLAALVLSPFLTHHLSRIEYGAFSVLTTAIALLSGVTQLGLNAAFFRSYSYDYESEKDRAGVLSTVLVLLLLISIPLALVVLVLAPWITTLLLNNSSFTDSVRFLGIVVLLQNLTIPGFAWLRAENRALFFSLLSIANLVTSLVATLVLVGILHEGVVGAVLATASGYGIVVCFTLPAILFHAGLRLRLDIARGLLSFGLPNVSAFVSVWILQLSDRFLLSHLGSLVQTATYSIAYSLGGVLGVLVLAPFTLAWPSAMYSIAKKEDASRVFQLVFRWYSIVLLFATFGLSLASTILLVLFFPPSYQASAPIIPIIAVSIMFYGLYNLFTVGCSVRRKPWIGVLFTTIAALLNIGLNIVFIPLYGSMGAALATLIAYATLALIMYVANQRIYPVPFEVGLFLLSLFIGVVLYVGSYVLTRGQSAIWIWSADFVALLLYGICLAGLGKFFPHIKQRLLELIKGFPNYGKIA